MFGSARNATRLKAETANNGLDWLLRQQQLVQTDRTPFEVIYRGTAFSVRHYPVASNRTIVLVPPVAVRASIYDLLPERSLVRHLRGAGFNVYVLDWDEPGREHDQLGLQTYALDMLVEALGAVRNDSGQQRLSLLGYCMGGLFNLLYAGTGLDHDIAGIVNIATPIDMHDGTFAAAIPKALQAPANIVRRHSNIRANTLHPALFHVPGRANTLAFKLASPMSGVLAMRKLLRNLDDRSKVAANSTLSAWLNDLCAYPGALMRDFMIKIWLHNELARGSLRLGDQETDLAHIDCPVLAIAGDADTIVGQSSSRKLLDRVSSHDKTHVVVPGGHVGVLAGSHAPDYCWPKIIDWLLLRGRNHSAGG